MHPYRTPSPPEAKTADATGDGGLRLAVGVMTAIAAVQVAIGLPALDPPAAPTVFGGVCFIAGLSWLLRQCHR